MGTRGGVQHRLTQGRQAGRAGSCAPPVPHRYGHSLPVRTGTSRWRPPLQPPPAPPPLHRSRSHAAHSLPASQGQGRQGALDYTPYGGLMPTNPPGWKRCTLSQGTPCMYHAYTPLLQKRLQPTSINPVTGRAMAAHPPTHSLHESLTGEHHHLQVYTLVLLPHYVSSCRLQPYKGPFSHCTHSLIPIADHTPIIKRLINMQTLAARYLEQPNKTCWQAHSAASFSLCLLPQWEALAEQNIKRDGFHRHLLLQPCAHSTYTTVLHPPNLLYTGSVLLHAPHT